MIRKCLIGIGMMGLLFFSLTSCSDSDPISDSQPIVSWSKSVPFIAEYSKGVFTSNWTSAQLVSSFKTITEENVLDYSFTLIDNSFYLVGYFSKVKIYRHLSYENSSERLYIEPNFTTCSGTLQCPDCSLSGGQCCCDDEPGCQTENCEKSFGVGGITPQ